MNEYAAGSTSIVETIFLQDSSSTAGAGKTGLVYNTASLTCYYKRSNGTVSVAVTLVTITTLGTFVSGGFKAVDGTNMPGVYEFHPPDAAFASGAKEVTFFFTGAAGMAPRPVKFRILAVNPDDAMRGGMTALPNANAGANNGLPLGNASGHVTPADASITDGKFTLPTEAAGTPTTFMTLLMWLAGMFGWRKVVKNSSSGTIVQYLSDGTTVKTTSTYTSASGVDTINKAT